ncbi:MAG: hypothetical protein HY841_07040 [Bacteroidetes bacterium]|nr:hypothetical protein [Bacteroidota bacterium]
MKKKNKLLTRLNEIEKILSLSDDKFEKVLDSLEEKYKEKITNDLKNINFRYILKTAEKIRRAKRLGLLSKSKHPKQ